jgi:sugar phosphate isomerase/epimerase
LKDLGLKVSCMALDHGLPPGASWDGKDEGAVRKVIDYVKDAIRKAKALEAETGYVGPCKKAKHLPRFREAATELAEFAAQHAIKLCVEHVPGKALSRAADALEFVVQIGHPNLYLLLDVGHTLITREKPSEIAAAAGAKLGYVQLNDNDGKKDRHWACTDGKMTHQFLKETLKGVRDAGYSSTLGLELSSKLPTLVGAFSKNHNLVLRLQNELEKEVA